MSGLTTTSARQSSFRTTSLISTSVPTVCSSRTSRAGRHRAHHPHPRHIAIPHGSRPRHTAMPHSPFSRPRHRRSPLSWTTPSRARMRRHRSPKKWGSMKPCRRRRARPPPPAARWGLPPRLPALLETRPSTSTSAMPTGLVRPRQAVRRLHLQRSRKRTPVVCAAGTWDTTSLLLMLIPVTWCIACAAPSCFTGRISSR
mmetsp:Transcript_14783/g.37595  ORF Transcript_14783/g.37595 Transcript_14783/m.37595 type:complete len:200 (-) Transcript_14783:541-1140(-)